jgi:hypothetical protein
VQRDDEIGRLFIAFNGLLSAINQREIALQQSERKLADILDHADSYVYLKDREGRYLYANRRVRTLFQRSMAQLSGLRDEEFFSSASVAMLRQHEQAVWQHGATLRVEEPTVDRRNGRAAIYQSVKLPLRGRPAKSTPCAGFPSISRNASRLKRRYALPPSPSKPRPASPCSISSCAFCASIRRLPTSRAGHKTSLRPARQHSALGTPAPGLLRSHVAHHPQGRRVP